MSISKDREEGEGGWKKVQLPRLSYGSRLRNKSALATGEGPSAVLTGIAKSIRENDPSWTCQVGLPKLAKDSQQPEDLEYTAVHNVLTECRRKYDLLNKQLRLKQETITQLTASRQQLLADQTNLSALTSEAERSLAALCGQSDTQSTACLEAAYYRKTMLHLTDRLKQDALITKDRIRVAKEILAGITHECSSVGREHASEGELSNNAQKVTEKLKDQLREEERERNAHLKSVEEALQSQINIQHTLAGRATESQNAAEEAMQAKPPQELDWLKVLQTHRLVARILSNKMDREMNKFSIVEHAFKLIKTATGVNDVHSLVAKFLSKEQIYGQLLGRIAENEHHIEQLKNERETLMRERKNLKDENIQLKNRTNLKKGSLGRESAGDPSAYTGLLKQLNQIIERESDVQLLKTHVTNWAQQSLRRFRKFGINIQNILFSSSSTNLLPSQQQNKQLKPQNNNSQRNETQDNKEAKQQLQNSDSKQIQKQKGKEQTESKVPQGTMQEMKKWFESFLKVLSHQSEMLVGNQGGQNSIMETQQTEAGDLLLSRSLQHILTTTEQEESANQIQECDQVNMWRIQILRQNDKFMREIQKKTEASRKALIEAEPKKKQIPSPTKPIKEEQEN